jgi:5-methylcytosine-specific restriction endonuclease McrA
MELCYTFDSARYFLGKPCKHDHLFPGTEQSLRVTVVVPVNKNGYGPYESSNCVACLQGKFRGRDWSFRYIDLLAMGFTDRHSLGKLCSKGHNWEGTGLSLRRNGQCEKCDNAKYLSADLEKRRKWSRAYYAKEDVKAKTAERNKRRWLLLTEDERRSRTEYKRQKRERLRAQGLTSLGKRPVSSWALVPKDELSQQAAKRNEERRAAADLRKKAKELERIAREQDPDWQAKEKERKRLIRLRRYQEDETFRIYNREKSKRRKALMKARHAVRVRARDIRARFATFGNCCAYCGEGGDMHMDHFVPLARGGTHALGNLLPACSRCNLSKRDHDAETWYRQQPYFSRSRWKKLREVLGIKKGPATQLTLL